MEHERRAKWKEATHESRQDSVYTADRRGQNCGDRSGSAVAGGGAERRIRRLRGLRELSEGSGKVPDRVPLSKSGQLDIAQG